MKSELYLIRGSVLIFLASLIALAMLMGCNKSLTFEGCQYRKTKISKDDNIYFGYVHDNTKCENSKHKIK